MDGPQPDGLLEAPVGAKAESASEKFPKVASNRYYLSATVGVKKTLEEVIGRTRL
jgi:hypothetical protein